MLVKWNFSFCFFVISFLHLFLHSKCKSDSQDQDDDESVSILASALEKESFFNETTTEAENPQQMASSSKKTFELDTPLSCRDLNGDAVDWWFIYKEDNGRRYVYYSSANVKAGETDPDALIDGITIDKYETSPLLKTIYQNQAVEDGSVWIAWNDQPNDNKDSFGNRVSPVKHAHAKGFFGIKAVLDEDHGNRVEVSSYAILHSLPSFPNLPFADLNADETVDGERKRAKRKLPPIKRIFDANISKNAQHFMCISLERSFVPLVDDELVYNATQKDQPSHVLFLQKYLRIIHPAIVGTNFDDFDMSFAHWRQYFSLFSVPFENAHRYFSKSTDKQRAEPRSAYSQADLPSDKPVGSERRLFPLSDTRYMANGRFCAKERLSRWSPSCTSKNGCIKGTEAACLSEAVIKSTNLQDQIVFKLLAKHGLSLIDMYDDWAALLLAELQNNFKRDYSRQVPPRHGMLVQTWNDSGTLPKEPEKKIYDENGKVISTVHIDNLGSIMFPTWKEGVNENGDAVYFYGPTKVVNAESKDHSKWLLGFTLDSFNGDIPAHHDKAKFVPLFCVGDLNRTKTQAQLTNQKQGRGGGLFCTTHHGLWEVMRRMSPFAALPKFRNNQDDEIRQIQHRLRPLCTTEFVAPKHGPKLLKDYRRDFIDFLRLQVNPLIRTKSADFVSFLNELSDFLVRARNQTEKKVFYAFAKFYERISTGTVDGAAEWIWKRTPPNRELNDEVAPILRRLPALVLDRHEPEDIDSPDKKILVHFKETDRFELMDEDSDEFIEHMRRQLGPADQPSDTDANEESGQNEANNDDDKVDEDGEDEDKDYDEDDEDYVPSDEEDEDDDDDDDDDFTIKSNEYDEYEGDIEEKYYYNTFNDQASIYTYDSQNHLQDYADFENLREAFYGKSESERESDDESPSSSVSDLSDSD